MNKRRKRDYSNEREYDSKPLRGFKQIKTMKICRLCPPFAFTYFLYVSSNSTFSWSLLYFRVIYHTKGYFAKN